MFLPNLLLMVLSILVGIAVANQSQQYPSCSANPGCSGLVGNCCPSDTGVDLTCCDATDVETDATCVANSACNALGLTGLCCPSEEGVTLDCCNGSTDSTAKECTAHAACSGLIGNCCPTDDGVTLDCKYRCVELALLHEVESHFLLFTLFFFFCRLQFGNCHHSFRLW